MAALWLLSVAAAIEAATGIALITYPQALVCCWAGILSVQELLWGGWPA